jgi:serine/threonine protein kinase
MTTPYGSYADLMSMTGPIGVNEVVRVGIAIAAALQATHVAGHVNGRVSPAGILHGGAGPTLSDVDDTPAPAGKATTTVDGFVPYASPEALLDQPQDVRSDIYSLAATMWTMLAGYPPFAPDGEESPDPAEYRERVLRRPAPLVPVTGVPGWLQTSLRRAMAKRPEDRYPRRPGSRTRRAPQSRRCRRSCVTRGRAPRPTSSSTSSRRSGAVPRTGGTTCFGGCGRRHDRPLLHSVLHRDLGSVRFRPGACRIGWSPGRSYWCARRHSNP